MTKNRDTHFHKLVKKLISTERTKLLKSVLEPLKPVEIANILLQLNLQHQLIVLENLDRERSSDVLNSLQGSPSILGNIVQQMSPDRLSDVIGICLRTMRQILLDCWMMIKQMHCWKNFRKKIVKN